ncbi:hypothetical protein CC78DRAFT_47188 [Lojkania enalia]|uniref:FHA domain-containing protein n=1 Tax=Lojkania enalia TaxID=147567 RepID=A0A9P4N608_9PLEO|nr:hypothetical protein CC78DRAFT_47188 [Didymosphaeria enalia]
MSSVPPAIEITLRSIDGLDEFDERKILLTPGSRIAVGRSSKDARKQLQQGPDNAYIDSPVISRSHAIISADTGLSRPLVLLKDTGSMHGTMVNNKPLLRHTEHELANGDMIQFGVNVVRDQESFIAKKYLFDSKYAAPATIPKPAVSSGFSVPLDSSDDEGFENENETAFDALYYGSQSNPVNVDDSEEMQQGLVEPEDEELNAAPVAHVAAMSPDSTSPRPRISIDLTDHDDDDVHDDDNSSVESNEAGDSSDNQEDDNLSDECSMDESDVASSRDASEELEHESQQDADSVRRLKMEAMLDHEKQKDVTDEQDSAENAPAPAPFLASQIPPPPPPPPVISAASRLFFSNPPAPFNVRIAEPEPANTIVYDIFENPPWDMVGPHVPPRSSAPSKFAAWGPSAPEFNNAISTRDRASQQPWLEESSQVIFSPLGGDSRQEWFLPSNKVPTGESVGAAAGNSSEQRKQYTPPVLTPFSDHKPSPSAKSEEHPLQQHTGRPYVVTPPAATTDDITSSLPQPNRRTKVSIPEIVDDDPQRPPTPTSVKSLKRKADVLEEEVDVAPVTPPAEADAQQTPVPTAQPTAQRPKKRLRSVMSYLATATAGVVVGGLSVVALFGNLPEHFFDD